MSSNDKRTDDGDKPEVEEAADAVQKIADDVDGSTQDPQPSEDGIDDAVIVDEIAADADQDDDGRVISSDDAPDLADDLTAAALDPLPLEDQVVEDAIAEEKSDDDERDTSSDEDYATFQPADSDPAPEPDPEPEMAEPEPAPVAPAPPPEQKSGGGFVPAVLGGLVAAGLGFGAAQFTGMDAEPVSTGPDPVETALAAQGDRMGALEDQIAQLAAALQSSDEDPLSGQLTELSGQIDTRISGLGDALASQLDTLETTLDGVDTRLTAVEKRPLVESSEAAQAALGAYEREIEALRQSLQTQQDSNAQIASELEAAVAAAQTEMAAVEDRAGSLQEQAEQTARAAAQREATASLDAALARGAPYEAPLAVLSEGSDVPPVLSEHAASGIASLSQLRGAYPGAARAALTASIKETVSQEPMGRMAAFLRAQTGARSLAPKDGDDPDAVLSRAEAALAEGQLADVLSELTALPPAGQAALSDWVGQAQTRLDVISAAADLASAAKTN